ncbi:hypothetical protein R9X47_08770 [Wukongibacter baidiensis]|uniref:hypothetical protein n=1 Tax=Wukongibacter baidiensis TaxID=1723361 RepID=UPI003D7FA338
MCFDTYKEKIKERLTRYFDIEENYIYNKETFELFAISNIRNERYIASKKLTIYAFENDEYCFLKHFKSLDESQLEELINILKCSINDFVNPHHDHMSSTITGVIAVDKTVKTDIIKGIKKFHYQKSFFFGLKGWCEVRLILIDLSKGEAIPSKKAKKAVQFYLP